MIEEFKCLRAVMKFMVLKNNAISIVTVVMKASITYRYVFEVNDMKINNDYYFSLFFIITNHYNINNN